jgi:hypothetical protein
MKKVLLQMMVCCGFFALASATTFAAAEDTTDGDATETTTTTTKVDNIAAFLAGADTEATYEFNNPVNVVYQSGKYLFVQDATGDMQIYGEVGQTYNPGDVIPAGFSGKYTSYYNTPEMVTPFSGFQAATTTATITPTEVALANITSTMANKYVKVTGVEVTVDSSKYYANVGDTKVQLYNRFNITLTAATNQTVLGVVAQYNGTPQIYPISVTADENAEEPVVVSNTKVDNIAAFLAGADTSVTYEFNNPVTVVYQNGTSLWAQDATGALLVYGNVGQTYAAGDVIPAGFTGKYTSYKGTPELVTPFSGFQAATATAEVTATEVDLEEFTTDYVNAYVKFVGVDIVKTDDSYYAKSDDITVLLYDKFGINLAEGENMTITGLVTIYNNVAQLYPLEVTDAAGTVVEKADAPTFSVKAGAVTAGTTVELTCDTEGAAIYYTLDGTTPTKESTLYSEPIVINEALTISAFAVVEGMLDSDVATAAYTIREASAYRGEFDTFNSSKANSSYSTYTNETGWTATNCAILAGQDEGITDNNPYFAFIGAKTTLAPTLNGKTTAAGTLVSPTIANGVGTLTFSYGLAFADTQIKCAIDIVKDEVVVATDTIENLSATKQVVYAYSHDFNVSGNVVIKISNLSPSANTGNKDRVSIWNLTWTDAIETGIANVATEATNAPVEFYNLQGVRVANPQGGLFIRRQGNKVEKVIIR